MCGLQFREGAVLKLRVTHGPVKPVSASSPQAEVGELQWDLLKKAGTSCRVMANFLQGHVLICVSGWKSTCISLTNCETTQNLKEDSNRHE